MSIGLRLDLRQTQQLVMTPQLQQAIKLLTMSNLEIADFVGVEVEKNPILEIADPDGLPERDTPVTTDSGAADISDGAPAALDARIDDHALTRDTFDTGAENLHDTAPSDGPSPLVNTGAAMPRVSGSHAESFSLEDRISVQPSLREHLRMQLGQMPAPCAATDLIARYLIEELDEHGYFRGETDDLADRLDVPFHAVEAGLKLVQACEPTGVGARTVKECLYLQLADRGHVASEMKVLLDNIDLLGRGEIKRLCALCGVSSEEFSCLVATLRTLDPRPCAGFDVIEPQTLVPDLMLTRTDWGGWRVELNAETLPNVLIDRTYRTEIAGSDDTAKTFLADCHTNANWLIKSLDQRAQTILKVATEILRRQEKFFEHGISALQPLTLKSVADEIGMHESTVSRVTTNKYMSTDRGIFELKFFFTNSIGEEGDVAAAAVRHRIKAMVQAEASDDVLSDDAIVESLRGEGIEIARRTVAKYRKSLNIPSSVDRRRQHAISAQL